MPASKEMVEQLASLTTPMLCVVGWLLDQNVPRPSRSSKTSTRIGAGKLTHVIMTRHQISFAKDVRSLVSVIEQLGNSFEEESMDLIVLDTKKIAGPVAVDAVRNVKKIGQEQFQAFTNDCLLEKTSQLMTPLSKTN